jgi:hypothetical protein
MDKSQQNLVVALIAILAIVGIGALVLARQGGFSAGGSSSSSSSVSSVSSASSSAFPGPDITVSHPNPNQKVTSPLVVTGQARGTWYFEASFPVRLLDSEGIQIAETAAQAQGEGEWMTTNFVPFTATIVFTTTSQTGTLVLEKDNPSGLPQNAASMTIPMRFK